MDDQSRNLILATALSFLVLLGWFVLGPILLPSAFPPTEETAPATQTAPQTATDATTPPAPGAAPAPAPEAATAAPQSREAVLAQAPRLPIRTARLAGSLSLVGGRIDDLSLSDYTVTVEPGSPTVTLLQPPGRRARLLRPLRLDALGAADRRRRARAATRSGPSRAARS